MHAAPYAKPPLLRVKVQPWHPVTPVHPSRCWKTQLQGWPVYNALSSFWGGEWSSQTLSCSGTCGFGPELCGYWSEESEWGRGRHLDILARNEPLVCDTRWERFGFVDRKLCWSLKLGAQGRSRPEAWISQRYCRLFQSREKKVHVSNQMTFEPSWKKQF